MSLMLVFKDTILGFVASVQLTANNMLRRGDWIVSERHGANGEVLDITQGSPDGVGSICRTIDIISWFSAGCVAR